MRDTILEEMRAGFAGVHQRQDVTNGRVNAGEVQGAKHETQLRNLEAAVFKRGRGADNDDADDARGLTRRDAYMFAAGISALGAVVVFLWKILPFLNAGPKP